MSRHWTSTLGRGLVIVLLAVAGAVVVARAIGVRLEVDGGGMRPMLSRFDEEAHVDAIEAARAEQIATTAPAATADVPAGDPASVARRPEAMWPAYRGASRTGRYDHPISTAWPDAGLPRLWGQPIGGGYASFSVADGRMFTIEQRRTREVVAAYDPATGAELWTHDWEERFEERMGGDGPRATPTWDDGRLFALGAGGELRSLDAVTGQLHWRTNILEDAGASNLTWAMAASPLVVDNMVIVLPGGPGERSVIAYDADSGDIIWTALGDVTGYTAPMLVELAGVRQLLVVTAHRAAGLRVEDGALLWDYPWLISMVPNMAQPVVVGANRVFISASYGQGSAMVEVSAEGGGEELRAREVWRTNRMKNKFSSSVLHEGFIYGLDDNILACLDVETGELVWKGGRYGYGQLLLSNGHLVVLTERGDVVLVRATPERHDEVASFPAIEGKTWNVPTIADGTLFVRNATEMAAFDIRP
ncbi:MAG: PQQ-like beta-propeller repeat protein [Acidobacteria bacterium]|nr:PQQ-like beta-propeller repeat protein [Acidobacteriota bacterium]